MICTALSYLRAVFINLVVIRSGVSPAVDSEPDAGVASGNRGGVDSDSDSS
jgi:hypothetical protein